uniref:5-hydroxyisourate hydrolase-like isoform X1 n=1 Tax=Monopterus albus TaxID=43700 RepID=UPI0009B45C03|nr:5-hydroxyisourate hydrolase-like isoform X1 [Monopterus albus]
MNLLQQRGTVGQRNKSSGKAEPSTPLQWIMTAAESSPLTTHVLNTGDGVPAARMALSLHRLDSSMMIWNMLSVGTTNGDGRCSGLISRAAFTPGMYKLRFETGSYWESLGQNCFYPYVEVVFNINDPEQRFHLPLLMSRFSYSTYRGS